MVLIQLLLPTSGAASADGLAPLAQTRARAGGPIHGRHGVCPITRKGTVDGPDGQSNRTTSSWWKS